jgi:hypothetical protein
MTHFRSGDPIWRIVSLSALACALAAPPTAAEPRPGTCSGDEIVARVLSIRIHSYELDPPPGTPRNEGFSSDAAWTEHVRARQLEGRIVEPLRKEFCRDHDCELSPEDTRQILDLLKRGEEKTHANDADATPLPRGAREMLLQMMANRKFHKALYERYGGEVISQVLGPNAVGAYRRWLEDEESHGRFEIMTPALRDAFYEAVSGYGGGRMAPEEAREVFSHMPWERPGR